MLLVFRHAGHTCTVGLVDAEGPATTCLGLRRKSSFIGWHGTREATAQRGSASSGGPAPDSIVGDAMEVGPADQALSHDRMEWRHVFVAPGGTGIPRRFDGHRTRAPSQARLVQAGAEALPARTRWTLWGREGLQLMYWPDELDARARQVMESTWDRQVRQAENESTSASELDADDEFHDFLLARRQTPAETRTRRRQWAMEEISLQARVPPQFLRQVWLRVQKGWITAEDLQWRFLGVMYQLRAHLVKCNDIYTRLPGKRATDAVVLFRRMPRDFRRIWRAEAKAEAEAPSDLALPLWSYGQPDDGSDGPRAVAHTMSSDPRDRLRPGVRERSRSP
jgi:hypothetical protein